MTTDPKPDDPILDWDDAYANGPYIAGGADYPDRWAAAAADFRRALLCENRADLDRGYGPAERNRYDVFLPAGSPAGTLVFVHGGYWKAFDKSFWSHLAAGALAHGHAVVMPSYTLAPDARIAMIVREVAAAIEAVAAASDGPVRLAGHSAGGHLVTRMLCADGLLRPQTVRRIVNTISISGLHDLRPLMKTQMNAILRLDAAEAVAESPALIEPLRDTRMTAWVGADERPEFRRQTRLIGQTRAGFGMQTATHEEPGRHHFDVIEDLADPDSSLTAALLRD
jgi:arylformamidase